MSDDRDSNVSTSTWDTREAEGKEASRALGPPPESIGRYRVRRLLGRGGFGAVYLALDDQLQRAVAIKVPHARLVSSPQDVELYLTEARTVASLEHSHIVPVYDIGESAEHPFFVVSKYIEGASLAQQIRSRRPGLPQAADLIATLAETLHFAHTRGFVHRDVKPGNILLGTEGEPYLADFGLALRETEIGKGPQYVGTPAYMSPEQARGEGHRVDGRSDIFSLGIVLYELLLGRRPFHAETRNELLEQISTLEPKPLRQCNGTIPKELERICLKALSKRASDRYATAQDLADDLRLFLAEQFRSASFARSAAAFVPSVNTPAAGEPASGRLFSDSLPIRIVPKGLRSFDEDDADFFLELLPGPRGRDGLPDFIRFWKKQIENRDPEQTFSVGLIYGPSGCGKSSLVKAGLLPRLAGWVEPLYVEAARDDTEQRLTRALRRACPSLDPQLTLPEMIAAMRRDGTGATGQKVLIVLDQFEQWLHARGNDDDSELLRALRQCDGAHVQCIVMVRDDFWIAISRLMRNLEVQLLEGHNIGLVDLFNPSHASKVLLAFGTAFGRFPENPSQLTAEQQKFLDQAIDALARNGEIIPVRLSLFAEMLKGKDWVPATLKAVGGIEGLGVTFLEETFSARTANPRHRAHARAAREVLQVLLPEQGVEIKGHTRSYRELLEASGYAQDPPRFADLLQALDTELRLVTPTEAHASPEEEGAASSPPKPSYQLAHDYLVANVRDWLSRKQKETRRGRAELRLAERTELWHVRREKQQLPSFWEFVAICCNTRPSHWTAFQAEMMKSATRFYLVRGLLALVLLAGAAGSVIEVHGRAVAKEMVSSLLRAETSDLPSILEDLEAYQRWAMPKLQAVQAASDRELLHRELALLRFDPLRAERSRQLLEFLPRATPEQARCMAREMSGALARIEPALWQQLEQGSTPSEVLTAATVLAAGAADDARWEKLARAIADHLVLQPPDEASEWLDNLMPVGNTLALPLQSIFTGTGAQGRADSQRPYVAALGLARFLRGDSENLARLMITHARYAPEFHALLVPLAEGRPRSLVQLHNLYTRTQAELKSPGAGTQDSGEEGRLAIERAANCLLAELMLGETGTLRSELIADADCTLRSTLIHRFAELGVPPATLVSLLEREPQASVRAALLLGLGEYGWAAIPASLQTRIDAAVQRSWQSPDGEEHAAANWLAQHWRLAVAAEKSPHEFDHDRGWFTTTQGHCLSVIRNRLDHAFALSTTEVTVAQIRRFRPDFYEPFQHILDEFVDAEHREDCPAIFVSCYDAMQYCNWLSREEGLDEVQWCYEQVGEGTYRAKDDHLQREGYRLPSFPEWQLACTAETTTQFSFGDNLRLLPHYAWYFSNSRSEGQHRARPVGRSKPNGLGLSDLYGNVWEWVISSEDRRAYSICGGSCDNDPVDLQPLWREDFRSPDMREIRVGFRIARTVKSMKD